jgi:hypothetical protein
MKWKLVPETPTKEMHEAMLAAAPQPDHDRMTKEEAQAKQDWNGGLECWLTIDTAPTDGTEILVCGESVERGTFYMSVGVCRFGRWFPSWYSKNELLPPDYWMPLPKPPTWS